MIKSFMEYINLNIMTIKPLTKNFVETMRNLWGELLKYWVFNEPMGVGVARAHLTYWETGQKFKVENFENVQLL